MRVTFVAFVYTLSHARTHLLAHHSKRRDLFWFLFSDLKKILYDFSSSVCVCECVCLASSFCVDLLFHSIFVCFFVCLFVCFFLMFFRDTNSGDVSVCGCVFPKFFWLRFLFVFFCNYFPQ